MTLRPIHPHALADAMGDPAAAGLVRPVSQPSHQTPERARWWVEPAAVFVFLAAVVGLAVFA